MLGVSAVGSSLFEIGFGQSIKDVMQSHVFGIYFRLKAKCQIFWPLIIFNGFKIKNNEFFTISNKSYVVMF